MRSSPHADAADRAVSPGDVALARVLIWTPAFSGSPEGGHRIQAEMTAQALRRRGDARVDLTSDPEVDLGRYDIVHGFTMPVHYGRRVKQAGLPMVLSTIYCSKDYYQRGPRSGSGREELIYRLRSTGSLVKAGLQGRAHAKAEELSQWTLQVKALYEMADLLLPNSGLEAEQIRQDLGTTAPMTVVPNAVDPAFLVEGDNETRQGVLMVGRFEPHKNQLNLIRACTKLGLPLTLVGSAHPHHTMYVDTCRAASSGAVRILPPRKQADLRNLYSMARIHALPSYFETTGLVSLEAALGGCRIVTTSRGYAEEYFRSDAEYCVPSDVDDIAEAIIRAENRGSSRELCERILNTYTWDHAGEATRAAYEQVLRPIRD